MKEVEISIVLQESIAKVYKEMEEAYDEVAQQLNFTCEGCPDNCCDSYFLHHTYIEWAYLWHGLKQLPLKRQQQIRKRALDYVTACETAKKQEERPEVMCPLNDEGLCSLYAYRLMVCRTHGVPSQMIRPDGKRFNFPGCFRCQEIVESLGTDTPPQFDRTALLQKLVRLEKVLMGDKRHLYPKVRLTIAEMLVKGPPSLPTPHCER